MSGAFPPLPVGSRARIVKSSHITNWTRIEVGRIGQVAGHLAFSLSGIGGPHLHLLVIPDTVERWDSRPGLHSTQIERVVAHAGTT